MISFDKTDGSVTIDFAAGPVRLHAPTFGGLKRLRAERVRLARAAQDKLTAWDADHPAPEDVGTEGEPGFEPADEAEVARRAEDRVMAAEQANLEATEAWWRLVLVGDDSFKKLAEGPVPDDVDEWPAGLLYDVRQIIPPNSSLDVILAAQSTPDRMVRHWGEVHSAPGSGSG